MADLKDTTYSNDAQNTGLNSQRASGVTGQNPINNLQPTAADSDGLLETSTNIFIYSNNNIVGMIQSFNISESRNITKLNAIGYEGVVQAVPSNTNGGQLTVSRMALYGSNIWRALGLTLTGTASSEIGARTHGTGLSLDGDTYITDATSAINTIPANEVFRTLRDQRVPLEIVYRHQMTGSNGGFYEEHYVDCWLSSYSTSYNVGTITVTEQATITYSDVY